jgi:hypothetical protein
MNKDKLYSAHPLKAYDAAYQGISALQTFPAEMQVAGIALLFREVSETSGLTVSELMQYSSRINADSDVRWDSKSRALQMYVKEELKK